MYFGTVTSAMMILKHLSWLDIGIKKADNDWKKPISIKSIIYLQTISD